MVGASSSPLVLASSANLTMEVTTYKQVAVCENSVGIGAKQAVIVQNRG